ncbi:hypothetical protein DPMN_094897 [Dreissena polymorpha]|uniref:Uncharacterized protein n=1 Tax=Dreissena polymorpha TaxID=45954 RepID=A0A9D4R3Y5_DREPO|nr:hypothetical protein DPMN_094897 [Dreissena polymorpha]
MINDVECRFCINKDQVHGSPLSLHSLVTSSTIKAACSGEVGGVKPRWYVLCFLLRVGEILFLITYSSIFSTTGRNVIPRKLHTSERSPLLLKTGVNDPILRLVGLSRVL